MGNTIHKSLLNALLIGIGSAILSIVIGLGAETFVSRVAYLGPAFLLLLLIILINILFDIIGVAATAASEAPLHAKAARKVPGAAQSLFLIRHADRVANFCTDVVGDIAGIIGGSLGAIIIFKLFTIPEATSRLPNAVMAGIVAGLTVGGKALGKKLAIDEADEIIFRVGRIMAWCERVTRINMFSDNRNNSGRGKRE